VEVIKRMYTNCEDEITVGKEIRLINYLTGVQQGDNVAPIIFLFIMLAVSQTLKGKWNFKNPCCGFFNEKKWGKSGKLKN
jgi:hypothetical protein